MMLGTKDYYQTNRVNCFELCKNKIYFAAFIGNGRSLKYWATFDEANGISTVDEYMDKVALLSNGGYKGAWSGWRIAIAV